MNNSRRTKIALAAIKSIDFDITNNLLEIEKLIKKANDGDAEFLLLGEAVLNGFSGLEWDYEKDIEVNAIAQDSAIMQVLSESCKKKKIGIGIGYYEKSDGFICDSYIIINENGEIVINSRRMSEGWKDPDFKDIRYKEGEALPLFKIGSSKCTICICGDLWTEIIAHRASQHESDIIIWPLYIDYSKEEWESTAKQEYLDLVKNIGKRTILINSIGVMPDSANGGVMDILPNGKISSEVDMFSTELLFIEL